MRRTITRSLVSLIRNQLLLKIKMNAMQKAQMQEQIEELKKLSVVMHCTQWGCAAVVTSFTTCVKHDPNTRGCQTEYCGIDMACQTETQPTTYEALAKEIAKRPMPEKTPRKILFQKTVPMITIPKKKKKMGCAKCNNTFQLCKNINCMQEGCSNCNMGCWACKTFY